MEYKPAPTSALVLVAPNTARDTTSTVMSQRTRRQLPEGEGDPRRLAPTHRHGYSRLLIEEVAHSPAHDAADFAALGRSTDELPSTTSSAVDFQPKSIAFDTVDHDCKSVEGKLHHDCKSVEDIKGATLRSPAAITIVALAIFSTIFSTLFLVIGILGPTYGRHIGKDHGLSPSKAAFLTTLVAKLIELSFATIMVAFIGQALTRRAVEKRKSGSGVTMAEMNMRMWIMQPGVLITQWSSTRYAGVSLLGFASIIAAIATLLYTSAATALVQPQPLLQWHPQELQVVVKSLIANPNFLLDNCKTPIDPLYDVEFNSSASNMNYSMAVTCLDIALGCPL